MSLKILHGDIIYSVTKDNLAVHEDSYIVIKDGIVENVFSSLPDKYQDIHVTDYKRGLIIPAFSDLHVHASQFIQRGTGMDCLLNDWLNHYTFPQEANFRNMDYAKKIYDMFVDEMIKHGTFHIAAFTTIHREASEYLFHRLEEKGLSAYVGKVNMNIQSPKILCETTKESLEETERFLANHTTTTTVKPILVPRFAPTCSEELMIGLGKLAHKYQVGLQTHLVESKWEAEEALRIFPGYSCDAEIYERCGLLDYGPSIFAHVIFPSEKDYEILKRHDCVSVHCPDSTSNIIAGIMPLKEFEQRNLAVALGCDIGAGQSAGIYRQVARAIQESKMKEFYEGKNYTLSVANAFYHATKEGGEIFGKIGTFLPGYRFDALVIDHVEDEGFPMKPEERLERFCYSGDDRNIVARYIDGKEI